MTEVEPIPLESSRLLDDFVLHGTRRIPKGDCWEAVPRTQLPDPPARLALHQLVSHGRHSILVPITMVTLNPQATEKSQSQLFYFPAS